MRGHVTVALLGAALLAAVAIGPASADVLARAAAVELPNLVPLPAGGVHVGTPDGGGPGNVLRFDTSTANRGTVALDLLAEPTDPTLQTAAASQCIEWATHRACVARQEVGRFVIHPTTAARWTSATKASWRQVARCRSA